MTNNSGSASTILSHDTVVERSPATPNHFASARHLDKLRTPMPGAERRIDPFQQHHSRMMRQSLCTPDHRIHASLQISDHFASLSINPTADPTTAMQSNTSCKQVGSKLITRGEPGSDTPLRSLHVGNRTHVTQRLRDDQVRLESPQRFHFREYNAFSVFKCSRTSVSISLLVASCGINVRVTGGSDCTPSGKSHS